MKNNKIVILALLITLSVVLSYVKIFSSIAFDSAPAFLASLLIGPVSGLIVGVIGHAATAMTSGFPFGMIHLLLMFFMGLCMYAFGWFAARYKGKDLTYQAFIAPCFWAYLLNVVIPLTCLGPLLSWPTVMGLFIPLSLATLANLLVAYLLAHFLPARMLLKLQEVAD